MCYLTDREAGVGASYNDDKKRGLLHFFLALLFRLTEAKCKVPDWGIKSGIGLPIGNVLESTLELTKVRL
jgi:hypothetical protein